MGAFNEASSRRVPFRHQRSPSRHGSDDFRVPTQIRGDPRRKRQWRRRRRGILALWARLPPGPIGFGCPNPFEQDPQNQGLVLAKSVQSADPGQAIAVLKGVKGTFLVELGYDLRKFGDQNAPNGSECTLTSPRF